MKPNKREDCDTLKQFLEQLAADRGVVITDEEYESLRSSELQSLAKPQRMGWIVVIPGLVFLLIGIGFSVSALVSLASVLEEAALIRLMFGIFLAGLGSYFFFL